MSNHTVDNHGASHGSAKSYLIGFVLSLILTAVPFWMVMDGSASHTTVLATVVGMAVVQIRASGLFPAHEHLVRGAMEPGGTDLPCSSSPSWSWVPCGSCTTSTST